MLDRRQFCAASAAVMLPVVANTARAQQWPSRPLQFVTPYPPGGLSDQITRFLADSVAKELGQTVIVTNKPGAGATMGTEFAAQSPSDGYHFFVTPMASITIAPWLRKVNYNVDDFVPIAKLASSYGLITTWKDAPWNTYRDFVNTAKAAPGKYSFASNGVGSVVHLTAVRLHQQAGIDVTHIPYKGSAESMNDLIGGRIDVMYDPVTLPRVKDGRLKALATTIATRNPELPDVPTLREQGFEMSTESWFGVFAPKGTPSEIVARMSVAARNAMETPTAKQTLLLASMYPDFEEPEMFWQRVQRNSSVFRDVIREANVQMDG